MASIALLREESLKVLPLEDRDMDNVYQDYRYMISVAVPSKPEGARELSPFVLSGSTKRGNQDWWTLSDFSNAKKRTSRGDSETGYCQENLYDCASLSTLLIDAVSNLKNGTGGPENFSFSRIAHNPQDVFTVETVKSDSKRDEASADKCGRLDTIQEGTLSHHSYARGRRLSCNDQRPNVPGALGESSRRKDHGTDYKPSKSAKRGQIQELWENKHDEEFFEDRGEICTYLFDDCCEQDDGEEASGDLIEREDARDASRWKVHIGKVERSGDEIGVFGAEKYFSCVQEGELEKQSVVVGDGGEEAEELAPSVHEFNDSSFHSRNSTPDPSETWSMPLSTSGSAHPLSDVVWRVHGGSELDSSLFRRTSSSCQRAASVLAIREAACKWSTSPRVLGDDLLRVKEDDEKRTRSRSSSCKSLEMSDGEAAGGKGDCSAEADERPMEKAEGGVDGGFRASRASFIASRASFTRRMEADMEAGNSSVNSKSAGERDGRGGKKKKGQPASPSNRLASFLALFKMSSERAGEERKTTTRSSSRSLSSSSRPSSGEGGAMAIVSQVHKASSEHQASSMADHLRARPPSFYRNAEMLPPNGKPPSPRSRRPASIARSTSAPPPPPSSSSSSLATSQHIKLVSPRPRSMDCLFDHPPRHPSPANHDLRRVVCPTPEWIDDIKSVVHSQQQQLHHNHRRAGESEASCSIVPSPCCRNGAISPPVESSRDGNHSHASAPTKASRKEEAMATQKKALKKQEDSIAMVVERERRKWELKNRARHLDMVMKKTTAKDDSFPCYYDSDSSSDLFEIQGLAGSAPNVTPLPSNLAPLSPDLAPLSHGDLPLYHHAPGLQ